MSCNPVHFGLYRAAQAPASICLWAEALDFRASFFDSPENSAPRDQTAPTADLSGPASFAPSWKRHCCDVSTPERFSSHRAGGPSENSAATGPRSAFCSSSFSNPSYFQNLPDGDAVGVRCPCPGPWTPSPTKC